VEWLRNAEMDRTIPPKAIGSDPVGNRYFGNNRRKWLDRYELPWIRIRLCPYCWCFV